MNDLYPETRPFDKIQAILLILFLLPAIPLFGKLAIRLDDLFIPALWIWAFWAENRRLRPSRLDAALMFIGISTLLSLLYGGMILGVQVIPGDYMEFVKLFKYWCAFHLGFFYLKDENSLSKVMIFATILVTIFGMCQLFNLMQVNSWLSPLYVSEIHMINLQGSILSRRITGPTGNPNMLGTMMLLVFWFGMSAVVKRYYRIILVGSSFVLILMTQSRTTLVALALGLLALGLAPTAKRGQRMVALGILGVGALVVLSGAMSYLADLTSGMESGSLQFRLKVWSAVWDSMGKTLWLGFGPSKSLDFIDIDSEYILVLKRYGFIGLSIMIWFYFEMYKLFANADSRLFRGMKYCILGAVVCNLTNSYYYNLQVMPVLLILAGGAWKTRAKPATILG